MHTERESIFRTITLVLSKAGVLKYSFIIGIQWQDHYNVIVAVSNNYMREHLQLQGVTEFKRDCNDLNTLVSLHAET